jgi:hypothetical protein
MLFGPDGPVKKSGRLDLNQRPFGPQPNALLACTAPDYSARPRYVPGAPATHRRSPPIRPRGEAQQHDRQLALRPEAGPNPWRAKTIEWQVSSPPPVFNFQAIPRVVGGPYEFGVPGARHVLMPGEEAEQVGARQATEVQAA